MLSDFLAAYIRYSTGSSRLRIGGFFICMCQFFRFCISGSDPSAHIRLPVTLPAPWSFPLPFLRPQEPSESAAHAAPRKTASLARPYPVWAPGIWRAFPGNLAVAKMRRQTLKGKMILCVEIHIIDDITMHAVQGTCISLLTHHAAGFFHWISACWENVIF